MEQKIKITWLGHACFLLEVEHFRVVIDPYIDNMIPGLPKMRVEAHAIYCSHEHEDHCATQVVALQKSTQANPFMIEIIDSFHDKDQGKKRGKNRITIFRYNDLKIVHFGDQGCMPTQQQLDQLRGADAVMIPVGGYFTIDALEAKAIITSIQPKVTIPMHYRNDDFGFPLISRLDPYLELVDDCVNYSGPSLEISRTNQKQTALLQLKTN